MTTPQEHVALAIRVMDAFLSRTDTAALARIEVKLAQLSLLAVVDPTLLRDAGSSQEDGEHALRRAAAELRAARIASGSTALAIAAAEAERRLLALLPSAPSDESA